MPDAADLPSWAPKYHSYSAAQTVDHCARQWVHRYRDKIRGGPKDYLILGNFVHAVLEHSALEGVHDPAALRELARRLFLLDVTTSDEWVQLWPDEAQFRAEAWRHIMRAKRAEAMGQLAKVKWVEREFRLTLNGVPFFGKADRIGELGGLWVPEDWKSGSADKYMPAQGRTGEMAAKMEKDRLKKLFQNPIYGAALEQSTDLKVGDGRFIFTSTDPVTIIESPKSLEAQALDWLAECWDKVHEAAKLGDETKASVGPLCSWCDAVDVCPEGRKQVAWMVKDGRKISPQTVDLLRRLSEPNELDDWVKYGHVRRVAEEEVYVAITPSFRRVTTGDRWALRDGETQLEPPTVGELRSELAQVLASPAPSLRRVRFLEATLRRRGFAVEPWVPTEAVAKPKPKRRKKLQSATARTKAAATKKTTRRRKATT